MSNKGYVAQVTFVLLCKRVSKKSPK